MQTPKARSGSKEAPQRISPRAVRQLKPNALEVDSASSRTRSKDKGPNIIDRRSPRSPAPEKKRPSKISELGFQISQLQEDLKKAKDELSLSESCKKQAQKEVEESKDQLLVISQKFEESQKQLSEQSASKETHIFELQKILQEQNQAWQCELEAVANEHSVGSTAFAAIIHEIQQLKVQLEIISESEKAQTKHAESAHLEIQDLEGCISDTFFLVENMTKELNNCNEPDTHPDAISTGTLSQLENAKQTVEALRLNGVKAIESYKSIASELDQSRARVNVVEGLLSQLQVDFHKVTNNTLSKSFQLDPAQNIAENQNTAKESNQLEAEVYHLKSEVSCLRSALEVAEVKYNEEQIQNAVQLRSASELVEQRRSESIAKEAELKAMLDKTKAEVEELKANLMDKETELQGISEDNEGLNLKLKKYLSSQRHAELEKELTVLKDNVVDLKGSLMDKETELQNIVEENKMLKSEIKRRERDKGKSDHDSVTEVEATRTAEREALTRLGIAMEEADKSNSRAARLTEQLEAAQAANQETEAELRKLKVQSDQWRKAAEAAAAVLSAGNNWKVVERTGSLDSNLNSGPRKIDMAYSEDMEDDLIKKKGNMLKKIGILWKKPPK